ncbi:HNH endonuclease [Myxococcota bacterium]|nr:HNH endonuclease [Myxococcota bacterium]
MLLRRDGPICRLCWQIFPKKQLTIDHIIPRCEGGSNKLTNLQLACAPCNHGRHHPPKKR